MRAFAVFRGIVVAWLTASVAGVLVALGPARLALGEVGVLSIGATLAFLAAMLTLVLLALRVAHRWWSRTLLILACLPLLWIAASPLAIATWAAHPVHAELTAQPPLGAVEVFPVCDDGTVLSAWYLPSSNGAGVVLAHGSGSTKGDLVSHAERLAGAGYGVLMLDARGHGDSEGAAQDLGWWGESDLDAAVTALAAMPDVDSGRIGLVGLSMGGEQSIGAAGVDARVAAVVAEGATARTAADSSGWLPRHPLGYVQRAMNVERDAFLGLLTDAPRPEGTLRQAALDAQVPMLLIAAGPLPDEVSAAEWIAADNPRVEVWAVPGAAHTGALAEGPAAWEARVIGFLNDSLPGANRAE